MALTNPPLKAPPSMIADWVEVAALANPRGFYVLSRLKRFWDTHRESEDSDPEGQYGPEEDTDEQGAGGEDADAFLDAVCNELSDRDNALQGCYPFVIAENGYRITLSDNLTRGQSIYLFCLLLSNCKKGDVLDGTWIPAIAPAVRDLFQACSTVAAAAEVNGCAISFGWPRPNNNPPFLAKLQEVYERFGEGLPVTTPRPGAEVHVKDGEIDIIAWRPRPDRSPGTTYLLGQVATGADWTEKSIRDGIRYFHRTWFDREPASRATPSIFIPFAVPPGNGGTRKDRMDLLISRFGTILDRLRIPLLATEGAALAATNSALLIERLADLGGIDTWVVNQIEALRATVAAGA